MIPDPVPYLDILAMAEGFVLLTSTSLPTLGPLFRAVRGQLSSAYGSGQGTSDQLHSSSKGNSRGASSGKWDKLRGHRLEDPESVTGTRENLDDIPLVERTKTKASHRQPPSIHKNVEISISSEASEQEHHHHHHHHHHQQTGNGG